MSLYKLIYTGWPEEVKFTYNLQDYTVYNTSSYGTIFSIGVVDKVTKSLWIHLIDKGSLDIKHKVGLNTNKYLNMALKKYVGFYQQPQAYYGYFIPDKFVNKYLIYNDKFTNIYKKIYSDEIYYDKSIYDGNVILNNDGEYVLPNEDEKIVIYDEQRYTKRFYSVLEDMFYNNGNIIQNIYSAYNIHPGSVIVIPNETYDFKNKAWNNIEDMILIFNNKHVYYNNIMLFDIIPSYEGSDNILVLNIFMYYQILADIYDEKEKTFVIYNMPIPLTIATYVKYSIDTFEIVEENVHIIPQISLFDGFYYRLNALFPYTFKIDKDKRRKICYLIFTKYNRSYKNIYLTYYGLFNSYDIDYYDRNFVEEKIFNEFYKETIFKYFDGEISKEELIDILRYPLLLSEEKPKVGAALPVDNVTKLDFSQPVIMIF